jgi:hypothetical protein
VMLSDDRRGIGRGPQGRVNVSRRATDHLALDPTKLCERGLHAAPSHQCPRAPPFHSRNTPVINLLLLWTGVR